MKARIIGHLSPETIRRIKRYQCKKVCKRPAFHMPFAGLGALVYGGDYGKGK